MAIARYTDSGGGGTGKKATYSTQQRKYATYGKQQTFDEKFRNFMTKPVNLSNVANKLASGTGGLYGNYNTPSYPNNIQQTPTTKFGRGIFGAAGAETANQNMPFGWNVPKQGYNQPVDRWATAPTAQGYQNYYADLQRRQEIDAGYRNLIKKQQMAAYDKWITRNRELRTAVSGSPITRPDGYNYFLPGGGYVPEAMNAGYNNTPSNSGNSYAGGGWGDYGGYYGGGGGGGYSTPAPEWWLSMTTWKV